MSSPKFRGKNRGKFHRFRGRKNMSNGDNVHVSVNNVNVDVAKLGEPLEETEMAGAAPNFSESSSSINVDSECRERYGREAIEKLEKGATVVVDESSADDNASISSSVLQAEAAGSPNWTSRDPDYELVDTKAGLQAAVRVLSACSTLIVDCEGLNLGVCGGALSLLCIRAVLSFPPSSASSDIDSAGGSPPHSYLFDMLLLERSKVSLQPVFDLLSSAKIRKVVYDGRMDFCALYFGYRVTMNNVIDLQLADVDSRGLRGEDHEKQMWRLLRCLAHNQVHNPRNAGKYMDVHLLQGLGACLVEHGVAGPEKGKIDHETWMNRPLTHAHRFYAANDLYLISLLLVHFSKTQYLSPDLPFWSQRYISIWSDSQPDPANAYRSNPLLPLEILRYDPAKSTYTGYTGSSNGYVHSDSSNRRRCDGCQRNLSMRSFPMSHAYGTRSFGAGGRFCCVCLAVQLWVKRNEYLDELRRKKREEKEKEEALRKGDAMQEIFGPIPKTGDSSPSMAAGGGPGSRSGAKQSTGNGKGKGKQKQKNGGVQRQGQSQPKAHQKTRNDPLSAASVEVPETAGAAAGAGEERKQPVEKEKGKGKGKQKQQNGQVQTQPEAHQEMQNGPPSAVSVDMPETAGAGAGEEQKQPVEKGKGKGKQKQKNGGVQGQGQLQPEAHQTTRNDPPSAASVEVPEAAGAAAGAGAGEEQKQPVEKGKGKGKGKQKQKNGKVQMQPPSAAGVEVPGAAGAATGVGAGEEQKQPVEKGKGKGKGKQKQKNGQVQTQPEARQEMQDGPLSAVNVEVHEAAGAATGPGEEQKQSAEKGKGKGKGKQRQKNGQPQAQFEAHQNDLPSAVSVKIPETTGAATGAGAGEEQKQSTGKEKGKGKQKQKNGGVQGRGEGQVRLEARQETQNSPPLATGVESPEAVGAGAGDGDGIGAGTEKEKKKQSVGKGKQRSKPKSGGAQARNGPPAASVESPGVTEAGNGNGTGTGTEAGKEEKRPAGKGKQKQGQKNGGTRGRQAQAQPEVHLKTWNSPSPASAGKSAARSEVPPDSPTHPNVGGPSSTTTGSGDANTIATATKGSGSRGNRGGRRSRGAEGRDGGRGREGGGSVSASTGS